MPTQSLVFIIIPVYNRAHLIGETLDSIIAQTYTNWECMVVDDGSNDETIKVVSNYAENDKRIKLFERPKTKQKGANACRNIGLNNAQGDYVVFFDSDDLMTVDHLQVKISAIMSQNYDYVITRTEYYNTTSEKHSDYYKFDDYRITAFNYVAQNINWLTLDVCIKKDLATSIIFNEELQSGQEYNYFSILVHHSTNAFFVDKVVSLRRHHADSIRGMLNNNQKLFSGAFKSKWQTYLDLEDIADHETKIFLVKKCLFYVAKGRNINYPPQKIKFIKVLFRELKTNAFYFFPMWLCFVVTKDKGYFFYKKMIGSKVLDFNLND